MVTNEIALLNPELTKDEKKVIVKFLSRKGNINKCAELTRLHRNTISKVRDNVSVENDTILKIKDFINTYLLPAA